MTWRAAVVRWFEPAEPKAARGPWTRWPRAADAALAFGILFGSVFAVTLSALPDGHEYTIGRVADLEPGAIALLGCAAGAVYWRRRNPVLVTATVLILLLVWGVADYGDGNDLALIAALYTVGRYTTRARVSMLVLSAAIAVSALGNVIDSNQRIDVAPALVLPAASWYGGRRVRRRGEYLTLLQERSDRAEADQLRRAREAVLDERSRIARELHDVVAHQVSVMTVQAGAAKTIARSDLETAIEAMGDVESAGRQALGELRHLLGVLRADTDEPDHLGPQPGLANIGALADRLRDGGADVTLTTSPHLGELVASVDLSAYRIVQEAITNIIKHAGGNPTVSIDLTIDRGRDVLIIDIVNTLCSASSPLPEFGFGISGMRERASLLGGTLTAVPFPPDRFRVQACLPLTPVKP